MNLVKKTVVLTGECDGYLSAVRVGEDLGVKIVGEKMEKGWLVGVKLGVELLVFVLDGNKTEKEYVGIDFRETDPVGCVILRENVVVSRGGAPIKASEVTERWRDGVSTPAHSTETEEEEEKEELFSRLTASDGAAFYIGVKEKLDELFVINPSEERLAKEIPDSEWVKIRYEKEDYYVVGRIREEGRIVLIGYGVPGKKTVAPPKVASFATFLELDDLPAYDGYWLFFQDATTGKLIRK